jgi:hypothetical protein
MRNGPADIGMGNSHAQRSAPMFARPLYAALVAGTFITASVAAEMPEPTAALPGIAGERWGFVSRYANPSEPALRYRMVALTKMAEVHAFARSCDTIEVAHEAVSLMFEVTGLGPVSPEELIFVGRNISELIESHKETIGEETCEWAFGNYGPDGARYAGLIRMKPHQGTVQDPEVTSSTAPRQK